MALEQSFKRRHSFEVGAAGRSKRSCKLGQAKVKL